jgi:hypothetical protein
MIFAVVFVVIGLSGIMIIIIMVYAIILNAHYLINVKNVKHFIKDLIIYNYYIFLSHAMDISGGTI